MTISQRIFEELKKQGKKQKELANYIGLSTSAISDWKTKGTNPTAEKISVIADFLEISTDYLLTGEEKNKNPSFFNNTISNNNNVEFNGEKNGDTTVSVPNLSKSSQFNRYPEIIEYLDKLSIRKRRRAELEIIEFLEDKYPIE